NYDTDSLIAAMSGLVRCIGATNKTMLGAMVPWRRPAATVTSMAVRQQFGWRRGEGASLVTEHLACRGRSARA
ncbi:MAG TPA: hypothetical protein VMU34_20220, partial [Mycobacterium sp.]|nr:hypothetical protein [Mycobacterium sp.]